MNTALLLLEIQNDYFPNGRMPLEKSLDASSKAQIALNAYREKKMPIIHVQHISTQPNASNLLPCTKGAEFYHSVAPMKGEMIIKKHYPNSFKDTSLLAYLNKNQIKNLVICGMMTHLTIDATVRAASDYNFNCMVLHDTCTARQLEFNQVIIPAQNVHYAFISALYPNYASIIGADDYMQKTGVRISAVA